EAEGGILRSLKAGHLQKRIVAARDRRVAELRDHTRHLVGTTLFPLPDEPPLPRHQPVAEDVPLPAGSIACAPLTATRFDTCLEQPARGKAPHAENLPGA